MTAQHMLARNIVRRITVGILACAGALGCRGESNGPSTNERVVASVAVTPATASVAVGATLQLTAVVKDSMGTALTGRDVSWETDAPVLASVSASGLVFANALGTLIVTATSEGRSGTAAVTVVPSGVASITLTAGSGIVAPGATLQCLATARDASGSVIPGQTFAWSTSSAAVATVDTGGRVTGVSTGTVIITAAAGTEVATVAVTVATLGTPTVLFEEAFEDSLFTARGWYDMFNGNIGPPTAVEHAPGSTQSLEVRFGTGAQLPSRAASGRHGFPASESVYVSYWTKHSTSWIGSGKPYHPHMFDILTTEEFAFAGPARTFLTVTLEENYTTGGSVGVFGVQDGRNINATRIDQDLTTVTENRAVAGCNGDPDGTTSDCYQVGGLYYNGRAYRSSALVFTDAVGPSYKGDWHKVEVFMKLNSIQNGKGQMDGIVQYWVDGKLAIDRHNVLYRTAAHPTMKFNQMIMAPYIADGSPTTQSLWIDDLVVMTARP